jgi:hypothetical protein
MTKYVHAAIRVLHPEAVTVFGDDIPSLKAFDEDGKSIEFDSGLLSAKVDELKNTFPNLPYQQLRAAAYPSVQEQLDMIWHTINSGKQIDKSSSFFKSIEGVKLEFPKS